MNKLASFIKTAGIYFIGNILTKLINFFLLPLYTEKLLPSQFGEYDLIVALISFFVPVLFFQIWDSMFRFAFDESENDNKYNIITNSFFVFFGGIIIYMLIYVIICKVFVFQFKGLIFIYGISIALQYQYSFISRVFLNNKLFVISGFFNTLTNALLNIILIGKFNIGVESLYIAAIAGVSIQVIIIEIVIKPLRNLKFGSLECKRIINMIKFSIPLCVASISYWLLSGYTKVIIVKRLGSYENGLYAVAGRFSITVSLLVNIFQYAWNEMAYSMANDYDRSKKYKISIEYITKVILLGSSVAILGVRLIFPYLINNIYIDALDIIPLSLIGIGFNTLAGFVATIFMTEKNTKSIFITTFISAVINIACINIFIDLWGLQGAAAALCLSFSILAIMRIINANKMLKLEKININITYLIILISAIYIYYKGNKISIIIFIFLIIFYSIFSFKYLLYQVFKTFVKAR